MSHESTDLRWPQTVATLEEALDTFPAGRTFLRRWTQVDEECEKVSGRCAQLMRALRVIRDSKVVLQDREWCRGIATDALAGEGAFK